VRIYVDSSALVKLVLAEKESPALAAYLASVDEMISSRIAHTELRRAVGRNPAAQDSALVETIERLVTRELTPEIAAEAGRLEPLALRTLDAIHLATALELGSELAAFVTYDACLAAAAAQHGLKVAAPA